MKIFSKNTKIESLEDNSQVKFWEKRAINWKKRAMLQSSKISLALWMDKFVIRSEESDYIVPYKL